MSIDNILKYIFSECSECNKIYLESILKKINKVDIKCKKCRLSVIIFSLIFKILKLNIPNLRSFPAFKLISMIAFTSERSGGEYEYEIYVMNADGSNQTNITNNPAMDMMPSWGP